MNGSAVQLRHRTFHRRTCAHFRERQGLALIAALTALVIVTGITVALARLAVIDHTMRSQDEAQLVADDLLRACEAPIQRWLAAESARIVLPPDADVPAVTVLHDQWRNEQRMITVRITAFDQCGMASLEAITSGSLLRLALPQPVVRWADSSIDDPDAVDGLDVLARRDDHRTLPVYPEPTDDAPAWFGDERHSAAPERNADTILPGVGACIATHNPGQLNVNTAPLQLVEQALREAGRGGFELIIAARQRGEPASIGALPVTAEPAQRTMQLVSQSHSWAMRIDLRVGPVSRAWWAIYQRAGNKWECVQRHVITE